MTAIHNDSKNVINNNRDCTRESVSEAGMTIIRNDFTNVNNNNHDCVQESASDTSMTIIQNDSLNFINDNRDCAKDSGNERSDDQVGMPSPVNNIEWFIGNLIGTWEEITVDSGAAESVAPETWHQEFPLLQTDRAHPAGFASATGQSMPHRGERQVHLLTGNGSPSAMRFQVTNVRKPLAAVSRIIQAGHRAVFDADGNYLQNTSTGEIIPLREKDGLFVLDAKIFKPGPETGFQGPGVNH